MKKVNKQKPIRPILRTMEIGDTHSYPLNRLTSVKAVCSTYGRENGKKFSTSLKKSSLVVTRLK